MPKPSALARSRTLGAQKPCRSPLPAIHVAAASAFGADFGGARRRLRAGAGHPRPHGGPVPAPPLRALPDALSERHAVGGGQRRRATASGSVRGARSCQGDARRRGGEGRAAGGEPRTRPPRPRGLQGLRLLQRVRRVRRLRGRPRAPQHRHRHGLRAHLPKHWQEGHFSAADAPSRRFRRLTRRLRVERAKPRVTDLGANLGCLQRRESGQRCSVFGQRAKR